VEVKRGTFALKLMHTFKLVLTPMFVTQILVIPRLLRA
jgi:hypothetical protein